MPRVGPKLLKIIEKYLIRSELEFSQPHLVSHLHVDDLVLLALQQRLEGEDEGQVGRGRDVVVPLELLVEAVRDLRK